MSVFAERRMLAASGVEELTVNVDGPYGMPLEVKEFNGTSGVLERENRGWGGKCWFLFSFVCVAAGF